MSTNRKHGAGSQFRYGICLNNECPKCKSKELQEIPARKDLICTECKQPLHECPPPKSWWEKNGNKVIAGVALLVVVGGGIVWLALPKHESNDTTVTGLMQTDSTTVTTGAGVDTLATTDTTSIVVEEQPMDNDTDEATTDADKAKVDAEKAKEKASQPKASQSSGKLNLGYGVYEGPLRNGKPNGMGTLRYKSSHRVSQYDNKGTVAEPGEYYQGKFVNGYPTIGSLFHSDGTLRCSINAGVPEF